MIEISTLEPKDTQLGEMIIVKKVDQFFELLVILTLFEHFTSLIVPAKFKQGVLIPKLKKPSLDNELLLSLRPISNLRFISKATEKVVAARLNSYLDDNNLHELV